MDNFASLLRALDNHSCKEEATIMLLLETVEKKNWQYILTYLEDNLDLTEKDIQFWFIKESNNICIDINRQLDLKLCEFLYIVTSAMSLPFNFELFDQGFGVKLKRLYDMKIITDSDMEVLKNVYIDLGKHTYKQSEKNIKKIDKMIVKIEKSEIKKVIGKNENIPEEFSFLDSIAKIVINMQNDMYDILSNVEISSYTKCQIDDDFYLMIEILKSADELEGMDEENFCKKFNLIYYVHEKDWPILKQWLLEKGCPDKYIGQFALRLNALYAIDMMKNKPDISIEEMIKDRFD